MGSAIEFRLFDWQPPIMRSSARFVTLAAAAASLLVGISDSKAAPKKKLPKPTSPPLSSPRAYADSVADVDCTNVLQRHASVRPLEPVVKAIVRREGSRVAKDEFETNAGFEQRSAAHYAQLFGGTNKIVFVKKMDPVFYTLKYDADRGIMQIGRPFESDIYHNEPRIAPREHSLQLFRDTLTIETYDASNAYGARAEVESSTKIRAALLFPTRQVPPLPGRDYAPLEVPMAIDAARKFKSNPFMLVVASLRSPFVVQSYDRQKATIDYPYETRLTSYGLKVDMQCIIFASGNDEVYRITFKPGS